jgi:hypothetical protein
LFAQVSAIQYEKYCFSPETFGALVRLLYWQATSAGESEATIIS